jgi:hypothetical protein
MKYILAILLPPFALVRVGRPIQFVLCGILFLASLIGLPFGVGIVGWIICSVWALVVVATTDSVRANLETMRELHQRPAPDEDDAANTHPA